MLFLICAYSVIFLVCLAFGQLTQLVFVKVTFPTSEPSDPIIKVILGLCIMIVSSSYISIFWPLDWRVTLFYIGIGSLTTLLCGSKILTDVRLLLKSFMSNPRWAQIIGVLLIAITLVLSTMPSSDIDEANYYAQTIGFMQSAPLMKGLAHLNTRLGFNNHWFLANAIFNFNFIGIGTSNRLNGFLHILTLLFLFRGANLTHVRLKLSSFLRLGLLLATAIPFHLIKHLPNPSAEMACHYLFWIVIIWLVERIEDGKVKLFDTDTLFVCLICVTLPTIKFSAYGAAILPLYYLFEWSRQKKQLKLPTGFAMMIIAGSLLTIIPWLTRNIVLTGYAIFPVPGTDFIEVPWKMSVIELHQEIKDIRLQPLSCLTASGRPYPQNSMEALRCWVKDSLRFYDIMLILISLTVPFMLFWRRKKSQTEEILLFGTIFILYLLNLISAPAPRFFYGYLIPLALWPIYYFWPKRAWIVPRLHLIGLCTLLGYTCAFPLYFYYFKKEKLYPPTEPFLSVRNLIIPTPYPKVEGKPTNIEGHILLLEPNTRCWNRCDCMPKRRSLGHYPTIPDLERASQNQK